MKTYMKIFSLLVSCLIFVACSNDDNSSADAKKDHVWKEQTDTIDKAKEVESMLQISVDNTQSAIEHQSE